MKKQKICGKITIKRDIRARMVKRLDLSIQKPNTLTSILPSILDELGVNIVSIVYEQGKELEFSRLVQHLDIRDSTNHRIEVEDSLSLKNYSNDSSEFNNCLSIYRLGRYRLSKYKAST